MAGELIHPPQPQENGQREMSDANAPQGTWPKGFNRDTPFTWPLVRAGELVTLNYGKALLDKNRIAGSIPVFGTNGQCGWHNQSLSKGPGLILGRKGMGNLGVKWCPSNFWVIDTAYFVTPKVENLHMKFLYYLIGYIGLNHLKDGTSNPSLSRDTFYAQLLPNPPGKHQQAIACILGSLDDKIELNRRRNRTLEAMARAIFQSWFVDFDPVRAKAAGQVPAGLSKDTATLFPDSFEDSALGPIPYGWKPTTLAGYCSKITDGAHKSPPSTNDGLPMASVKDMTDWGITVGTCRLIAKVDFESLVANDCQPLQGDILLAKDGATCLETACEYRQNDRVVLLSSVAILRPRSLAEAPYLHLWLTSEETKSYLREGFVSGSAIPRVVLKDLKRAQVLRPNDAVLQKFSQIIEPQRAAIRANVQNSTSLAAMRDALLPKLISGELRVPDAERIVGRAV